MHDCRGRQHHRICGTWRRRNDYGDDAGRLQLGGERERGVARSFSSVRHRFRYPHLYGGCERRGRPKCDRGRRRRNNYGESGRSWRTFTDAYAYADAHTHAHADSDSNPNSNANPNV